MRSGSEGAETGTEVSYGEHRRGLLLRALPSALLTVVASAFVYGLLELALAPELFRASLPVYVVLWGVPLIVLGLLRGPLRRHVEWVVVSGDVAFTVALAASLLLSRQPTFSVTLLLSLKTMATAVFFPWGPAFQSVSVGATVVLYWGLLQASGRSAEAIQSVDFALGPLVGAVLSVVGAVILDRARRGLFDNASRRYQAETALRRTQGQLELALVASKAGAWESDVRTGNSRYSSNWLRLLGYGEGEVGPGLDDWLELVHPDDRERLTGYIAEHLRDPSLLYEIEYRVLDKEKDWRWVLSRATLVRDAAGEPERLLGMHLDLTELKQAQEQHLQLERRFKRLIDANIIGIIVVNMDGRVTEANEVFLDMLGRDRSDLPFRWDEISPPEWRDADRRAFRELRERGVATPSQHELARKDGSRLPVLLGAALLEEGTDYCFAFVLDLTKQKRAEGNTAALLRLAHDVSGSADLPDLCARVQLHTTRLLHCEAVTTFQWDPDRKVLRFFGQHGLSPELAAAIDTVEFSAGDLPDSGAGLLHGELLVFNDPRSGGTKLADICARFGVTAVAAAPLQVRSTYRGILAALRTEHEAPFAPWQCDFLVGVAKEFAVGIEAIERHRAQQEEAAVAAALARIGEGLIAALGTPKLLDELCKLTTEVLGCDCSHTVLWQPEAGAFRVLAAHGYSPELMEIMRSVELPSSLLDEVFAQLEGAEVMRIPATAGPVELQLGRHDIGLDAELAMGLRRRGALIGVHSAAYRGRSEPFSPLQERIAQGIAHLSSLALEDFLLVQELERANRLKSDFLATISHELRTPLSILLGYNDLLCDEAFGPVLPEQRQTLERMDRSARELLELIEATLDLSRLEAGHVEMDVEDVAPAELLRELELETRDLRKQKPRLAFRWEAAPGLPQLRTDRRKLKVILKNLISNALKFTENGHISVRALADDGGIGLTVSDTGIGIPPDALSVIFEPFRQASDVMTRSQGGVGLGLYIVQQLLSLLGGTIEVTSEVGRGTMFHVSLPLNPPDSAAGTDFSDARSLQRE